MGKFKKVFRRLGDPRAANASHNLVDILFIALAAVLCGAEGASDMAEFGRSKEVIVAQISATGAWDPQSRYLQPGLSLARPSDVRERISALHGGVCEVQSAGSQRGHCHRRQSPARRLRTRSQHYADAHGQCLSRQRRGWHWHRARRPAATRRRRVGSAGHAHAQALHCYCRCAALPSAPSPPRCSSGAATMCWRSRKIRASCSMPWWPRLCSRRHAQHHPTARTVHSRSARVATGHRHARHDPGGDPRLSGDRCLGQDHVAPTAPWPPRRQAVRALLPAFQILPATKVLRIVRSHWAIENQLHWLLDVVFDEDRNRSRKDNAPENLAILRSSRSTSCDHHPEPISMRQKIKRAGWDNSFLLSVFSHMR